jgi:tight adherence protein C
VNPLLPGLALALCLVIAVRGAALARSTPEGAERLLGLDGSERRRRRSLYAGLRTALGRRFGRSVLGLMTDRRKAFVRHRIDAAGRPGGLTLEGYAATKAASTIILGLLGLLLVLITGSPLLLPALALVGWLQLDLSLAAQAKRRQAQIERDLPDFLDVLVVTVNAGLGFRDALGRVADSLGGPLGQECRIALQQMGYGAARRTAFEGIRERSDSEALSQFMTALLQAEELGAPLGEALNAIADDMRKSFGQRARREAARAVPRISIIVVIIVMPGVMILLLAAFFIGSGADYGALLGG